MSETKLYEIKYLKQGKPATTEYARFYDATKARRYGFSQKEKHRATSIDVAPVTEEWI